MIQIKNLSKTFPMKDGAVYALRNINLTIPDGAIYGIIGMSGAGKSTLVRCINLLERPTEGSVVIDGVALESLTPAQLPEEYLLPHGAGRCEKGGCRKTRPGAAGSGGSAG